MNIRSLRWLAVSLLCAHAPLVGAQTETFGDLRFEFDNESLRPSGPAQVALDKAYRASRAVGGSVIEALLHPTARTCRDTPEQRAFGTDFFARRKPMTIPENAKVIFVPVAKDQVLPFAMSDLVTYPTAPTKILAYTFRHTVPPEGDRPMRLVNGSAIELLAEDGDSLRIVRGCLTEKGAEQVRKKLATQPQPPR